MKLLLEVRSPPDTTTVCLILLQSVRSWRSSFTAQRTTSRDRRTSRADGRQRISGPVAGLPGWCGAQLFADPLPSVPAVMTVVSPGVVGTDGIRRRFPVRQAVPVVGAFVIGMDGVIGAIGLALVELTEVLTRAAIVLHVVAAIVLALAGSRLLLRRSTLCKPAGSIPLRPNEAFMFGILFSVGGCPACGPIALSIGAASAIVGGPVLAFGVLASFIAGRDRAARRCLRRRPPASCHRGAGLAAPRPRRRRVVPRRVRLLRLQGCRRSGDHPPPRRTGWRSPVDRAVTTHSRSYAV